MTAIRLVLLLICGAWLAPASLAEDTPEPLRVATLLPFVEDALQTAPAPDFVLVASVRRELHVPVAEGLVDLGNPHSPNFEGLAEARADLLIGDRSIHGHLASRVESTGAELMLIDATTANGTLDALLEVGERVGAGPRLGSEVAAARTRIDALQIPEPRTVLALFGTPGRFFVVSDRSWLGNLLTQLGYENLAPGGDERLPGFVAVSDEAMGLLEPELVLVVAHGDPRKIGAEVDRRVQAGGAWSFLGSAALGVHVLDPQRFGSQPGLGLPDAAAQLVEYAEPRPAAEVRLR